MAVAVALARGPIRSGPSWRGRAKVEDLEVLTKHGNLSSFFLRFSAGGEAVPVRSGLLRETMLVPVPVGERLMAESA